jgi:hypothetical protein
MNTIRSFTTATNSNNDSDINTAANDVEKESAPPPARPMTEQDLDDLIEEEPIDEAFSGFELVTLGTASGHSSTRRAVNSVLLRMGMIDRI